MSTDTNPTHLYDPGIYEVSLTASRCGAYDTLAIEINVIATTREETDNQSLHIFPNPVRGNVNVEITSAHKGQNHIEIISAAGIFCGHYDLTERHNIISLHMLREGLYFLRLMRGSEMITTQPLLIRTMP